jgi:hypothetical protein
VKLPFLLDKLAELNIFLLVKLRFFPVQLPYWHWRTQPISSAAHFRQITFSTPDVSMPPIFKLCKALGRTTRSKLWSYSSPKANLWRAIGEKNIQDGKTWENH